jgi:hypothetical protein
MSRLKKRNIATGSNQPQPGISRFFIAAALVAAAGCRTETRDIHGWNSIVWGTSVESAQRALGPKAHVLPEASGKSKNGPPSRWEERLSVGGIKIAGIDCNVVISVPYGTHSVKSILITPLRTTEALAQTRAADFEMLLEALITKYGAPTSSLELETLGVERVIWRFPSTVIELSRYEESRFADTGAVSLSFQSSDMVKSDEPM